MDDIIGKIIQNLDKITNAILMLDGRVKALEEKLTKDDGIIDDGYESRGDDER